jgi:AraC-like DNA-binding protein
VPRPFAIGEVRDYIDRHCGDTLLVPRLARMAGLSTFHFIRAFRAAVGATPHQYLRQRRLERAGELLATTAIPITEICGRVGFQSLGSFSALFKQATGESPTAYRARRRQRVYIPTCFIRMYRAD